MKWHVLEPPPLCNSDSVYVPIVHIERTHSRALASFNRYEDAKEFLGSVIKNYIPDDWSLHREYKNDFEHVFHYVSPGYEP